MSIDERAYKELCWRATVIEGFINIVLAECKIASPDRAKIDSCLKGAVKTIDRMQVRISDLRLDSRLDSDLLLELDSLKEQIKESVRSNDNLKTQKIIDDLHPIFGNSKPVTKIVARLYILADKKSA